MTRVQLWKWDKREFDGEQVNDLLSVLLPSERPPDLERQPVSRKIQLILSRCLLKLVLARSIDIAPEEVFLSRNEFGRPFLPGLPQVSFNVSHSGHLLVIVLAHDAQVGVDIEQRNRELDWHGIARHYFCASEYSQIAQLEPQGGRSLFFRLWTSKEAYLKACGVGLSQPLNSFAVPATTRRSRASTKMCINGEAWWLAPLTGLPVDFVGTIAIDKYPIRVEPGPNVYEQLFQSTHAGR
jgi:phosphopantetheinyl transferase